MIIIILVLIISQETDDNEHLAIKTENSTCYPFLVTKDPIVGRYRSFYILFGDLHYIVLP